MKALEAWALLLRDQYGVLPKFVHTDKDMAEIGMSRRVSPYNIKRAKQEYYFIDVNFKPYGRADPNDIEGKERIPMPSRFG